VVRHNLFLIGFSSFVQGFFSKSHKRFFYPLFVWRGQVFLFGKEAAAARSTTIFSPDTNVVLPSTEEKDHHSEEKNTRAY